MFSGIVQGVGKVAKVSSKKDSITIEITPPKNFTKNLKKGASVSVDGVCLTSLDNGIKKMKFVKLGNLNKFYHSFEAVNIHVF